MSRKDYRRLKVILGDEELTRVVHRKKEANRPKEDWTPGYAQFSSQGDAGCHYFGEDRLCHLQLERGEGALTSVCAQYPRHQIQVDQRVERAGTLACPEAARLCLLEDDAMDIVEFEPESDFSLWRPALHLEGKTCSYLSEFDRVRDALMKILSNRALPLGDRLGMLVVLSDQLNPVLVKGRAADETALQAELERATSEAFGAELSSALSDVGASGRATHVLLSFILVIYGSSVGPRLQKLLEGVVATYENSGAFASGSQFGGLLSETHFRNVAAAYETRRNELLEHHHARIDTYFTNYCLNFVMQTPFFDQNDLRLYVRELLLRVATLRFLFFSHPDVLSDRDQRRVPQEIVDATAVATFQRFAREVEHSLVFAQKLRGMLSSVKADALGDLLCLTRL
jgi:lysine-N-methylase